VAFAVIGGTDPLDPLLFRSRPTWAPAADQGVRPTGRTGNLYNGFVAVETTYTHLRDKLASVLDQVAEDREVVIVRRRGARDVALVPADELAGLMETAHLLRSPINARRLLTALRRAKGRKGKLESIEKLRREMGLPSEG
jgi:antitoxin YefM